MQFNDGYGDYDPEYDSDYDPEYDSEIENEADTETETEIDSEHESDQSIIRTEVYDTCGNHKGSYIGVIQELDPESFDDMVDETDDEIDEEVDSEANPEIDYSSSYSRNSKGKWSNGIRELTDEEYDRIFTEHGYRVFWPSKGRGVMEEEEKRKRWRDES